MLWEIIILVEKIHELIQCLPVQQAEMVAHSLSTLTTGLWDCCYWLELDKVRNLMQIWLPEVYFSAEGVTLGATEFILSEDELSQAN